MTTREKSPAFQFYPKDWISDINLLMMTPEERGLYIVALCHDWLEDGLTEDQLKSLCTTSKGTSMLVQQMFVQHPTNPQKLSNPRLQKERIRQAEWREKCRQGGIKSGKTRSYTSKGTSNLLRSKREVNTNSSSSSSSSNNINKAYELSEILKPISDGNLKTGLERWIAWRKTEKKKPVTALALKQLLKRYENKSQQLLEDLRYSVSQDWTGVFPERRNVISPKSDTNKNQPISKRGLEFVNAAIPKNNTTGT